MIVVMAEMTPVKVDTMVDRETSTPRKGEGGRC